MIPKSASFSFYYSKRVLYEKTFEMKIKCALICYQFTLLHNVYTYCTKEEFNHATALACLPAHGLEFHILI